MVCDNMETAETSINVTVTNSSDDDEGPSNTETKDRRLWRDLVAYWLLGLCNNYGYVVMLTAAHDILKEFNPQEGGDNDNNTFNNVLNTTISYAEDGKRDCNKISTGAILLADILPSLFVKLIASFFPLFIHIRTILCIILSCAGFSVVAYANVEWLVYFGVACTSLSSGLGEASFLSYSSQYNKNVVSTWSSGTGGAGIIGAISYAGLTGLGLSPKMTLLVMLVVPVLEAIAFWGILRHPTNADNINTSIATVSEAPSEKQEVIETLPEDERPLVTLNDKMRFIPSLFKYMVPLVLVYLFEYYINQGLFELVFFPNIWLDASAQYRWYQVLYQVGVFISRSSVNIYHFEKIWIMAALQFVNLVFFLFEAIYYFTPNIYIIFVLIIWEGLLGGGGYVNTFYRISHEVPPKRREYSMMIVSLSDTLGIALAGIFAIPTHNAICDLPVPERLLRTYHSN